MKESSIFERSIWPTKKIGVQKCPTFSAVVPKRVKRDPGQAETKTLIGGHQSADWGLGAVGLSQKFNFH